MDGLHCGYAESGIISLAVIDRHTAIGIGTHGDLPGIYPRIQAPAYSFAWLNGSFKAVFRRNSRGDVDDAAQLGKLYGLLEEGFIAVHMGGNHQIRGKLGFADDVHKHIQTALSVPHVNMSIAPLPAYQSRGVGLSQKVLHFRPGRLGRAPVGQSGLCSDHLVHKDDVPSHRAGEGSGRHLKGAGEHACGDPLRFERTDLCVEGFYVPCCSVCPVKSDYSSDSVGDNLGNLHLRSAAEKSRFSACPDDMDMLIHKAGSHHKSGGIYNLSGQIPEIFIQMILEL